MNLSQFYPMSYTQKSLWLHQKMAPKSPFYNNALLLKISGKFDSAICQQALSEIVKKHHALRSIFSQKDEYFLQEIIEFQPIIIDKVDLSTFAPNQEQMVSGLIKREITRPFDLSKGPIFKFKLFQLTDSSCYLLCNIHHIASDGWSWRVLFTEFFQLYYDILQGNSFTLSKLPLQYENFSEQQYQYKKNKYDQKNIAYWKNELYKLPILKLPVNHPRNILPTYNGRKAEYIISDELWLKVKEIALVNSASPFIIFLAGFQLHIAKISNQKDFGIGVPFANRNGSALEKMIGFFVNTLIFRVKIKENTSFLENLLQTRNKAFELYDHQDINFEDIISQTNIEKDSQFSTLCQVMFVMQDNYFPQAKSLPFDVDYEVPDNDTALFEILFEVIDLEKKHFINVRYNTDIFDQQFIDSFVKCYLELLGYFLQNPHAQCSEYDNNFYESCKFLIPVENYVEIDNKFSLPQSDYEKCIAEIWSEIFKKDQISRHDHFIKIGGNSIDAVRCIARIENRYNVTVDLPTFFENTILMNLAQVVENVMLSAKPKHQIAILPMPDNQKILLSFSQLRLWFLSRLFPGDTSYNVSGFITIEGSIDIAKLENAVKTIIDRHQILRSVVAMELGKPYLILQETPAKIIDIFSNFYLQNFEDIKEWMYQHAQQPFDLSSGPLYRFILINVNHELNYLFICFHHIVFDGWSVDIFLKELSILYQQEKFDVINQLPVLSIQYADFAFWQQATYEHLVKPKLNYWIEKLSGWNSLKLPADFVKSQSFTQENNHLNFKVSQEVYSNFVLFSKTQDVTLFTLFISIFFILLSDFTGEDDILIAIPFSGRTHSTVENLIGYFINTLLVREKVDLSISFFSFLQKMKATIIDAYQHADVPFEKIIDAMIRDREPVANPFVSILFNFNNTPSNTIDIPNLSLSVDTINNAISKVDLNFMITYCNNELVFDIDYDGRIYDQSTMNALLNKYNRLLEEAILNPSIAISYLLTSTYQKNHEEMVFPTENINTQFLRAVTQFKHKIAIKTSEIELTYEELMNQSAQLAKALRYYVNQSEGNIAICVPHNELMVLMILAVLQAGYTYVPINYDDPLIWVQQVVSDVDAVGFFYCDQTVNEEIINFFTHSQGRPFISVSTLRNTNTCEVKLPSIQNKKSAYILYTSGSTGKPKGVLQTHEAVLHHIKNYINSTSMTQVDNVLQVARYTFDASIMDLFGCLFSGATLYPVDLKKQGILFLLDTIKSNKISVLHVTPSVLRLLYRYIQTSHDLNLVRVLVLGGEEVTRSDIQIIRESFSGDCRFINGLGPTECTLALQYITSVSVLSQDLDKVPVGYPVPGVEVILLNNCGDSAEFCGELVYKSKYLAKKYWNNEKLTGDKFSICKSDSQVRLYYTGDFARRLANGMYVFLGRRDNQVKIRGHRIELTYIESILTKCSLVKQAVVLIKESSPQSLIAFVVLNTTTLEIIDIKSFLKKHLPEYMLPEKIIILDQIPLNTNGKLDKQELWKIEKINFYNSPLSSYDTSNQDEITQKVVSILQDDFKVHSENIKCNLFDMGFNSISIVELHAKLQLAFRIEINLIDLFNYSQIDLLCTHLRDILSKTEQNIDKLAEIKERSVKQRAVKKKHIDKRKREIL